MSSLFANLTRHWGVRYLGAGAIDKLPTKRTFGFGAQSRVSAKTHGTATRWIGLAIGLAFVASALTGCTAPDTVSQACKTACQNEPSYGEIVACQNNCQNPGARAEVREKHEDGPSADGGGSFF